MKKSNITGWKDVYSFTLIQTLKNKAFIISFVFMLVLMLVSMPLLNRFVIGDDNTNQSSPIQKVYINNETSLSALDFSNLKKDERFAYITFEEKQEAYETILNRIETLEHQSILLTLSEENGMFSLNFEKASNGPIKDATLSQLGEAVSMEFQILKLKAMGVTEEQAALLDAKVESSIYFADVEGNPVIEKDTSITSTEYWFVYGLLFITMMVNMMASIQVATSIVTEKSTRVVEYLLISVRPLALMVGKVLAMLTAVLLQMVTMVAMVFVSNRFTSNINSGGNTLSQLLPKDILQNLNMINIVLCFATILLGFIFYAVLASMSGATVSKLEDINEGLTLFTMTNLVGVYIGLGAANVLMGSGINSYVIFSLLFPLSSPFLLPGAILVGKASLPLVAGAIVLQIVFTMLLFKFVAKVYETLILHTGNKIKVKDLFKLSKTV